MAHRFHVHADGNTIIVHDHKTNEKLSLTPDGDAHTPYRAVQTAARWINERVDQLEEKGVADPDE